MDRQRPSSEVNRIKLVDSEPLVYIKKPITFSNVHHVGPLAMNNQHQIKDGSTVSKRQSLVRPKLTVVSPKRKIRLPVSSSTDFARSTADGESSSCSIDQEKILGTFTVRYPGDRYPGDGCTSDSDEDEDDGVFDDSTDKISDNDDDDGLNNDDDVLYTTSVNTFDEEEFPETDAYEDDVTGDDNTSNSTLSTGGISEDDEDRTTSRLSSASLTCQLSKCSLQEDAPYPLLRSLFANKPPTIYFTVEHEKVCQLPVEIRKILRWKSSSVTPKVVKSCIARSGFRITKKTTNWLGVWGKHMKPPSFKSIQSYQKVNHFPGTFHIGRKDKLWRNYCKMKIAFGKQEFNFLPQTFVLPSDVNQLKKVWDESLTRNKWIIKPPASARGSGIRLIHKWSQLPKKRPVIVQRYLSKPYLINGHKFDLRIYVYVASFDPLRIYIFEDGLARFATSKYSSSSKSLSDKYMHLTNYSINKKNKNVYTISNNDDLKDAHNSYKWSLKALWKYLQAEGINTNKIWESIKDIAVKAILCGESNVNTLTKQNISNRLSCHELFGLDIILDNKLKPWLLEVNISPSLHSNSDLDRKIKGQLIKDIFNMTGFYLPRSLLVNSSGISNMNEITADRFWFDARTLTTDEKAKHTYYLQRHDDIRTRNSILDVLTPDDLLMLMETEDEFSRCGSFHRLMPTSQPKYFLNLLKTPRYYNLLLEEWTKQYMRDVHRTGVGVSILQSMASVGVHMSKSSQVDPRHQWILSQNGSMNARSKRVNHLSIYKSFPLPSIGKSRSSTQHSSLMSSRYTMKARTIGFKNPHIANADNNTTARVVRDSTRKKCDSKFRVDRVTKR